MAYREELAELMRQATLNKSQRAIARDANVSQGTVGNMVMGKVSSREICIRVARAANVDVNSLLDAAGYEQQSDPRDGYEKIVITLQDKCKGISKADLEEVQKVVREVLGME